MRDYDYDTDGEGIVSVLFNEPKLLKFPATMCPGRDRSCFSALQRAEIAEIGCAAVRALREVQVSVLFNEPKLLKWRWSATAISKTEVSVLFNEPKLLKYCVQRTLARRRRRVSVLFNEPKLLKSPFLPSASRTDAVSVLFNEPKLLKSNTAFQT